MKRRGSVQEGWTIRTGDLNLLLAAVEDLGEPDRRIDTLLDRLLNCENDDEPVPPYTASIDAAVGLVQRTLPGWQWRVMSGYLSDDAFVMPDFGDPLQGERLQAEWPLACQRDPLDYLGTDLDRRPAGQPAIALVQSMLMALQAILREKGRPDLPVQEYPNHLH